MFKKALKFLLSIVVSIFAAIAMVQIIAPIIIVNQALLDFIQQNSTFIQIILAIFLLLAINLVNKFDKLVQKIGIKRSIYKHVLCAILSIIITLTTVHIFIPFIVHYNEKIVGFIEKYNYLIDFFLTIILLVCLEYGRYIKQLYKKGVLANRFGIFLHEYNKKPEDISAGNEFLSNACEKCHEINIIAATGYKTFATEKSPLFSAFQNSKTRANVVLFNPNSEHFAQRAIDLDMDVNRYRTDFFTSLDVLTALNVQGGVDNRIQLKLYNGYPGWKLIQLCEYFMWVQRYTPDGHVQYSPCFAFEAVEDGLFYGFSDRFQRYWQGHYLGTYDFKNEIVTYKAKDGTAREPEKLIRPSYE